MWSLQKKKLLVFTCQSEQGEGTYFFFLLCICDDDPPLPWGDHTKDVLMCLVRTDQHSWHDQLNSVTGKAERRLLVLLSPGGRLWHWKHRTVAPALRTLLLMVARGEKASEDRAWRVSVSTALLLAVGSPAGLCRARMPGRTRCGAVRMPAARCHCRSRQRRVGPAGSGTAGREPQGRLSCPGPLRVPGPFLRARKGWFSQHFVPRFALRQQEPVTTLGGAADSPEGGQVLPRDLDKSEGWAVANCVKVNKEQCWTLQLGGGSPGWQCRLGNKSLESSPTGRDLEVLVDSKLNMSQQSALEA